MMYLILTLVSIAGVCGCYVGDKHSNFENAVAKGLGFFLALIAVLFFFLAVITFILNLLGVS